MINLVFFCTLLLSRTKMILWRLFALTAVSNAYKTLPNNFGYFGGSSNKLSNTASRRPSRSISSKLNWGNDLDFSVALYDLQLILETKISQELSNPTFASLGTLYIAGFVTGLSPCSLGMLPVTLSYLGSSDRQELPYRSVFYAIGMAAAFTGLGLSAALAGQLFGEISVSVDGTSSFAATAIAALSGGAKLLVSTIYLVMGLNLLNVIDVQFPSLERAMSGLWATPSSSTTTTTASSSSPLVWSLQAMVLGATASLISSPCSSPVLAALLTFVSSAPSVYVGALLLLLFSLGYASPVVAAGVAAATNSAARAESSSSTPVAAAAAAAPVYEVGSTVLAALLVSYGTYSALSSARDIFLS